jgi:hypothetical protein
MLLEPVGNESVFHRVLCSYQANLPQAAVSDCDSRSVRNMEDWNVCLSCNLSIYLIFRDTANMR